MFFLIALKASMALGVRQPGLWIRISHNFTLNPKMFVCPQKLHVSPFLHLSQDQNGVNLTQVSLAWGFSRLLCSFHLFLGNSSFLQQDIQGSPGPGPGPCSVSNLTSFPLPAAQPCQTPRRVMDYSCTALSFPDCWGLLCHVSKCSV